MKYCDFTGSTPAEALACDEALLDACDSGAEEAVLRVWQPLRAFVVLGYGGRLTEEVREAACRRRRVPVLRRASGGGTVVQTPGCLNYALALRHDERGPFATLRGAMTFVLERHRAVLARLTRQPVEIAGISDLAIKGRKVSGNSQRRKRRAALVHGTFLLSLDPALVEQLLPMPPRQPAYRDHRRHADFLLNLSLPASALTRALRAAWKAETPLEPPREAVTALARGRYRDAAWAHRL